MKVATETGRSHRSRTARLVGCTGQSKRGFVVWGSPLPHAGHDGSTDGSTLFWKVFRALQYPERSWAKADLWALGSAFSTGSIVGGWSCSTLFSGWLRIAFWTVVWCISLQTASYSSARMVPLDRYWAIDGRNLDWRVSLLIGWPDGCVTIECDGWKVRRALARY